MLDADTAASVRNERAQVLLDGVDAARFFGTGDRLLIELERQHPQVQFHARDHVLTLEGSASQLRTATKAVTEILELVRRGVEVSLRDVREASRQAARGAAVTRAFGEAILAVRGREVRPQTAGQCAYVRGIEEHAVTFGIGPAGTGKTYLAMAKAVQALHQREIAKIILTRPAVETGERLGYLPGSLEEKIEPYLRPLFDALGSMMEAELLPQLVANGTIEVAPLAYMRGRTLNESFVVLDEAQNTTPEQMKMFLTRLGYGSKMVVTGDPTQTDLPLQASGLRVVRHVLQEVAGIHFAELTADDVVRHSLVGRIVEAYAVYEQQRAGREGHE